MRIILCYTHTPQRAQQRTADTLEDVRAREDSVNSSTLKHTRLYNPLVIAY